MSRRRIRLKNHTNNLRIFIRKGSLVFSKSFMRAVKDKGIIVTKRDTFNNNCIIINHGNIKGVKAGQNTSRVYLINKPDFIRYCSSKKLNSKTLKEFYPKVYSSYKEVDKYPVILKPRGGHHGYGIHIINSKRELRIFSQRHLDNYFIEEYVPVIHEFRFNILDKEVYQVSRKDLLTKKSTKGGYEFEWKSLGKDAKISKNFWDYVYKVINQFHEIVGDNLGHYALDIFRCEHNKYYVCEINSACGFGEYTIDKLKESIDNKYKSGDLEKYRIR